MNPTVFLGGVHGAGKTTIGRQLGLFLQASHVTAGTLIRETANPAGAAATSTSKMVADVDANQAKLLQGLDAYRARFGKGTVLLDGHFTLLDSNEGVVKIPMTVFRRIAPVALILVETKTSVIHARLMGRDGRAPSPDVLDALATGESAHAHAISRNLGIPIFIVNGDSGFDSIEKSIGPQIRTILGAVT